MCRAAADRSPRSPRSPRWTRFFAQPVKPKLSRKVVGGARTDLNRYWAKFEEVTSVNCLCLARIMPRPDNEINENIANETKENGKMK